MESNNKLRRPIPGQNPENWAGGLFERIERPVDWCTVRQGSEEELRRDKKGSRSLLQDIVEGRIDTGALSPDEAKVLLGVEQKDFRRKG